jgi:hypothetical protein
MSLKTPYKFKNSYGGAPGPHGLQMYSRYKKEKRKTPKRYTAASGKWQNRIFNSTPSPANVLKRRASRLSPICSKAVKYKSLARIKPMYAENSGPQKCT